MFFELSKIGWFLAVPSNLMWTALVIGTLLSLTRLRRLGLGLSLVSLVLIGAIGIGPVSLALIRPLDDRFPPPPIDAPAPAGIVVLGGSFDSTVSDGRSTITLNDAAERLTEAVALARRFPEARIVFTGGLGQLFSTRDANEADLARRFFAEMGIEPSRLTFERESRNTYENAVYTRRLVAPRPGERWLLVTSAWHMPRAVGCFRVAGFPVTAYPVDYRSRGDEHDAATVFPSLSDGLRRFDVAAREWAGLVVYHLTGRTDALFPAP